MYFDSSLLFTNAYECCLLRNLIIEMDWYTYIFTHMEVIKTELSQNSKIL